MRLHRWRLPSRRVPAPSWRTLADDGKFDEAYAAMQDGQQPAADNPRNLLLAADVARLSHHSGQAVAPLRRLLASFPAIRVRRWPRSHSAVCCLMSWDVPARRQRHSRELVRERWQKMRSQGKWKRGRGPATLPRLARGPSSICSFIPTVGVTDRCDATADWNQPADTCCCSTVCRGRTR